MEHRKAEKQCKHHIIHITEIIKQKYEINEFHYQKYGTPKHKATYQNIKINKDILIDDNKEVREMWEKKGGITIDPTTTNLFQELIKLII